MRQAVIYLRVSTIEQTTANQEQLAHYHQVRDAWGGVRTLDGR